MNPPRPALDVRPVTLTGFGVALRPSASSDAPALHAVSTPETFRSFPWQPAGPKGRGLAGTGAS